MNQMLNLDQLEPESVVPAYPSQAPMPMTGAAPGYNDLYRTDSPMQFGGTPSSYDADTQGMFTMSLEDQQQPHAQVSTLDPNYFGHHTTL